MAVAGGATALTVSPAAHTAQTVEKNDFLIHRLNEHEHMYPEIIQVGSSFAGSNIVITAVLVPIP